MEEKIFRELELIRKEHNRLKEISYQDLKEIYNTCIVLEKRMDAIKGIHRKNTILFLAILVLSFAGRLYSFRQYR